MASMKSWKREREREVLLFDLSQKDFENFIRFMPEYGTNINQSEEIKDGAESRLSNNRIRKLSTAQKLNF